MIINNKKQDWKIDIPVVINFFVRPRTFEKAFSIIKTVKPRQLFLISDGPRKNVPSDYSKVEECRKIAEEIDWNCEVYKFYNEENKGLFDTYFDNMKKVFEIVDKCIFLEDDLIPSESFFPYCKYLLEKYENDLRIQYVSGMNPLGVYNEPDGDYFFSGESSIWGYGIWKRTFNNMNLNYRKNSYALRCIIDVAKEQKKGYERRIIKTASNPMWEGHQPHVEFYKNFMRFSDSQLCIVPCKNLISHIGIGSEESTHGSSSLKVLPKGTRFLHFSKTFELTFPLKDPEFIVRDIKYEKKIRNILAYNQPLKQLYRKIEALILALLHGDIKRVKYKFKHLFVRDKSK